MRSWLRIRVAGVCGLLLVAAIPNAIPALAGGPDPGPDFNGDGDADLAIGVPYEDFPGSADVGGVAVIYGSWNGLDGAAPVDDQFWNQNSTGVQGGAETGDRFGRALATGDFDGDGYDDLAIGVPYEDITVGGANVANAGVVQVLYGSSTGLTADGDLLLSQDTAGVLDLVQAGDLFGFSLAAAQLGGGPEDDLVVGIPYEDLGSRTDAGAINVIYGSPTGLTATGNKLWSQDSTDILDIAENGDRFGWSLAAGNFGNGSVGGADLAIGIPYEDTHTGTSDGGAVAVIYNSSQGLSAAQNQFWSITGPQAGRRFGWSLAAANFGRSGEADLAIGAPYDDFDGGADKGTVWVMYGDHFDGLLAAPIQMWRQGTGGILDTADEGDLFGYALAGANLGKSTNADLAIGVPGETKNSLHYKAGAVSVLYGSSAVGGLLTNDDQFWSQGSSGIEGDPEIGDAFGSSLAAADFGKASYADLAVGVPGESNEGAGDDAAGSVSVIYSTSAGLEATGDQFWWQDSSGIGDSTEDFDRFGWNLAH